MTVNRLLEHDVPVPEAIARVLEDAGIEFVFGMPGGRTGAIVIVRRRATRHTLIPFGPALIAGAFTGLLVPLG